MSKLFWQWYTDVEKHINKSEAIWDMAWYMVYNTDQRLQNKEPLTIWLCRPQTIWNWSYSKEPESFVFLEKTTFVICGPSLMLSHLILSLGWLLCWVLISCLEFFAVVWWTLLDTTVFYWQMTNEITSCTAGWHKTASALKQLHCMTGGCFQLCLDSTSITLHNLTYNKYKTQI